MLFIKDFRIFYLEINSKAAYDNYKLNKILKNNNLKSIYEKLILKNNMDLIRELS